MSSDNSGPGTGSHAKSGVDEAAKESFPASDPPANTPPPGSRKAEREAAAEADQARADDPHGVGSVGAAGDAEPKGRPTSDRFKTEAHLAKGAPRSTD